MKETQDKNSGSVAKNSNNTKDVDDGEYGQGCCTTKAGNGI